MMKVVALLKNKVSQIKQVALCRLIILDFVKKLKKFNQSNFLKIKLRYFPVLKISNSKLKVKHQLKRK